MQYFIDERKMIMKMQNLKIGDTVFVDTGINGYLKGVIVYKHETQEDTYNVKLDLGEYGETIESFSAKRIYKNMKNNQEYCSEKLTELLVGKFDYPKNKLHWVKFPTFNYKRLAKLCEISTWLRDKYDYHILVRHPRGFHGDGIEFKMWTYDIIVKNPENDWEGVDLSKACTYNSYEEALENAIYDLITGNVNL